MDESPFKEDPPSIGARLLSLAKEMVIVLVSASTLKASGQLWEIKCALEERKPILAIWAYRADRTLIPGLNVELWSDPNIIKFLENL